MTNMFESRLMYLDLASPLPCSVRSCGRPARMALAEPDITTVGLWSIFPVCQDCTHDLRGSASALLGTSSGH